MARLVLSVCIYFLLTFYLSAQQTVTSSPPAQTFLQNSLAALAGGQTLTDVTLTGTARRIAGSDDESGTVVIKTLVGAGSRIDLTLPSGTRREIRNTSSALVAGSWSGPDNVPHAMAYHNLLTDPGWAPAFTIASLLSARNAVITYVGSETRDAQSVIHIIVCRQFPTISVDPGALPQHLTQTDLFLDATTFLLAAVAFNTHPDTNAGLDIPVEIIYGDYRQVSGAQLPFHIQKKLNGSLSLDLQFSTATLNSGLSASALGIQ